MSKDFEKIAIMAGSVVGLACLLAYTFVHTGALLARYTDPWQVGYVAAFGIELMVALQAWRYARASKSHRTKRLVAALGAALCISMLANIAEGYAVHYGQPLTWQSIGRIDPIQALVGITATGLISFLVFALSDIVGGDVGQVVCKSEHRAPLVLAQSEPDASLELCDCGREFATVQALSAHKRFCDQQKVRGNGHG